MSRFLRRKHVLKEMMEDDFALPTENQQIVRLTACRGNNLHEVEAATPDVDNFLVTMPNKFRNNMFVKRGDFVLVEPIEEGAKVKAEIVKIITPEHVKEFTKAGVWPQRFAKNSKPDSEEEHEEDEDADEFMVRNKNRPAAALPQHTEEETDSEEESNDDDDDEEMIASSSSEEEVKPK